MAVRSCQQRLVAALHAHRRNAGLCVVATSGYSSLTVTPAAVPRGGSCIPFAHWACVGEINMFQRMLPSAMLLVLASIAVLGLSSGSARAAYPDRPIRFIIPSAPGGSPDVIMRLLMNQMSTQMGTPI